MKKAKDVLADFDRPMKLVDDPDFPHATPEQTARDPLADFNHPQILVEDDAPTPTARNKKAQGNALGSRRNNRKP